MYTIKNLNKDQIELLKYAIHKLKDQRYQDLWSCKSPNLTDVILEKIGEIDDLIQLLRVSPN